MTQLAAASSDPASAMKVMDEMRLATVAPAISKLLLPLCTANARAAGVACSIRLAVARGGSGDRCLPSLSASHTLRSLLRCCSDYSTTALLHWIGTLVSYACLFPLRPYGDHGPPHIPTDCSARTENLAARGGCRATTFKSAQGCLRSGACRCAWLCRVICNVMRRVSMPREHAA
jgi:hypothetical protein